MRVLMVDNEAKELIAETIQYAEEHKYPRSWMVARVNNPDGPAPGDNQRHCCYLETGFKVVFTIEEQPFGWCKHISVSVAALDRLPNVEAVKMIMQEFGMTQPLEECHTWIEESTPKAVNVLSKI